MGISMTYEEARKYIVDVGKTGSRLGLSRMRELLGRLGNPQDRLPVIHIAGTNGKGSVAAFISSILAAAGYRVGRYVSPVVFQYEECIQYEDSSGRFLIDRELLANVVEETVRGAEKMQGDGWESPTVFEVETAMSFLAFLHWHCDVVILETGLGGKEDATNVMKTVAASVITPISMDHREFLGDSITAIAAQKAGIIKRGCPVIALQEEQEAMDVIRSTSKELGAPLYEVLQQDLSFVQVDIRGSRFRYRSGEYDIAMPGIYQIGNACLALETCLCLRDVFPVREDYLSQGLANARWPGRFQVISEEPLIILDGAHNPAGAIALRESCEQLLGGRVLHGIMGVFRDKEYVRMVELLTPVFQDVLTITPSNQRGLSGEVLAAKWREHGCREATVADSVEQALSTAKKKCQPGEGIIIFGSLSFFGELGRIQGKD